jgi:hypothetical protein
VSIDIFREENKPKLYFAEQIKVLNIDKLGHNFVILFD